MKHKKDVSDMIDCLDVLRSYNLMKEIELYIINIRASYIYTLVVKLEMSFIREIKYVLRAW